MVRTSTAARTDCAPAPGSGGRTNAAQAAGRRRATRAGRAPECQLEVAAALVERPAEDLLRALEAVEHGVLVRVQPLGGAARVPALGQPREQRLAQPRGGVVLGDERADVRATKRASRSSRRSGATRPRPRRSGRRRCGRPARRSGAPGPPPRWPTRKPSRPGGGRAQRDALALAERRSQLRLDPARGRVRRARRPRPAARLPGASVSARASRPRARCTPPGPRARRGGRPGRRRCPRPTARPPGPSGRGRSPARATPLDVRSSPASSSRTSWVRRASAPPIQRTRSRSMWRMSCATRKSARVKMRAEESSSAMISDVPALSRSVSSSIQARHSSFWPTR